MYDHSNGTEKFLSSSDSHCVQPSACLYVWDAVGCILLCFKFYAVLPTLQSSALCSALTLNGSGTSVLTDDTVLVTLQGALCMQRIYNIYI